MPFPEKRRVTEKRLAANRAAAQHSTGPRTPEGKQRSAFNSFRHGLYSTQSATLRQALARAGHDPDEYDRLLSELIEAWQPEDAQQRLFVEDLARLYSLQRLNHEALQQWMARQARKHRHQEATRRRDVNRRAVDKPHSYTLETLGWRGVPPGPASGPTEKFDRVRALLEDLEARFERGEWEAEELFRQLYGKNPTSVGKEIIALFQQCAEEGCSEERRAKFNELLRQEREDLAEEEKLRAEDVEDWIEPEDYWEPALIPLDGTWQFLVAQETALDRQIGSKTRLLMRLQDRKEKARRQPAESPITTASPEDRTPETASPESSIDHQPSSIFNRQSQGSVQSEDLQNGADELQAQASRPPQEATGETRAFASGKRQPSRKKTKISATNPNDPLESIASRAVAASRTTTKANGEYRQG
ncbi:MAG TPA: hypothetical protein VKV05_02490 [Terriglobales bacterium]|nr:hypothetical protein [Terriglobales bacterium]